MYIKIVVLVECYFVCIENVKSTPNSPEIASKYVALGVVLVGEGGSSGCKERNSYFSDHVNNIKF